MVAGVSRARAPLILLPPSEGKATGGAPRGHRGAELAFPELDPARRAVRDAARREIAGGDVAAGRLLGVGGRHLTRALTEWDELDDGPVMAAGLRYNGVVWTALDLTTLDRAGRRRLDQRVLVPSGLWGLVAASDPIPAYRLKMGVRVPPIGSLAAFWRPLITPIIDRRAAGGWIIDLLPAEHASAIDTGALADSRLLSVTLLEGGGPGPRRVIGHAGKALKGRLARAIIEADARTPRAVAALAVPGLRCVGAVPAPRGAAIAFEGVPDT